MTLLALLRHGRTEWNAAGRLQGRQDIALSAEGQAALAGRRLPAMLADARWHVSPLRRARETAALLGCDDAVEPALIEMDFGEFEGRRLAELRAELGADLARNEARGLDFTPPGGESPRMVQARLQPWLAAIAAEGGKHVAVSHKAVIRSVLSLAYDWPMLDKPPVKLDWTCLHLFTLDAGGRPRPRQMNLPLDSA